MVEYYNLIGFISPTGKPLGFLMPIFKSEGNCWFQTLDDSGNIRNFYKTIRPEDLFFCDVVSSPYTIGSPAICAFGFSESDIIWGNREDVSKNLEKRIDELSEYPFIKAEALKFLGKEKEYLEAVEQATASIRHLNFKVSENWKRNAIGWVSSEIFVGRKKELDEFKQLFSSDGKTHVLSIHTRGKGGIGKTQLLLQMQKNCEKRSDITYTKKLIDFYHTETRTKIDMMRLIAESLNTTGFYKFNDKIKQFNQLTDMSQTKDLIKEIEDTFLNEYSNLSEQKNKIIVLFFDTYEIIQGSDFSRWLESEFFPKLKGNTRIIVSGRQPLNIIHADEIELQSFEITDTVEFWKKCFKVDNQSELEKRIGSLEVIEKIHSLAKGRPILLALFADWCQHEYNHILPEKIIKEIEEKSQNQEEPEKFKEQLFEKLLVEQVISLKEPEDMAVTYMAFAYRRMTPEMFSFITDISLEQSNEILLKTLKSLSFIKYKESGEEKSVLLHDEMRDLIVQHYWENCDKDCSTRKNIADKLVKYYDILLENIDLSEMEKAVLYAERLYYQLYADINKGLKYFSLRFDEYIERSQFESCDLFIQEISSHQFYTILSHSEQLEIDIREIQRLNELYRSSDVLYKAKKIETEKNIALENNQQIYARFKYECGIAYFWTSRFEEAIHNFSESEKLFRKLLRQDVSSQKKTSEFQYNLACALNWIGYCYYRNSNFKDAEIEFDRSIKEFLKPRYTKYTGIIDIQNVHSNLCSTLRYQGRFYKSALNGKIAIDIAEKKGINKRELARFSIALGAAYKYLNKSFEIFTMFQDAENILNEIHEPLLNARLLTEMSLTLYRHRDYIFLLEYYRRGKHHEEAIKRFREAFPTAEERIKKAESRLKKAKNILEGEMKISLEVAELYFYLAEYYTIGGNWKDAIEFFKKSEKVSKEVHNEYREIDAIICQMMCYYFEGDEKENEKQIQDCEKRVRKIGRIYHNLFGKMEIIIGDFIYNQFLKNNDIEYLRLSFDRYVTACNHMYQFGRTSLERFYAIFRIMLNRIIEIELERLPSAESIESLRDIWNYDRYNREVCRAYGDKFDEIIDFIIKRIELNLHTDKLEHYIKDYEKKVSPFFINREELNFAPLYSAMLLQLQLDFGSTLNQANAYHSLGYLYDLNNNMFEARQNYKSALEHIEKIVEERKNADLLILQARILIRQAAVTYGRGELNRILEYARCDDFIRILDNYVKTNQQDIDTAFENLKDAINILDMLEKTKDHNDEIIADVKARLELRLGQYLMLTKGISEEIEGHFEESVKKAKEGKNIFWQMNAIGNLVAYYYLSKQWNIKKERIEVLRNQFNELNERQYYPFLKGHLEIIEGSAIYDEIFLHPEDESIIYEAFDHYILASRYKAEYLDRHLYEAIVILLDRIAKLPKQSIKILREKVYPRIQQKRPIGKLAEDAFKIVERCMYIHSEVL